MPEGSGRAAVAFRVPSGTEQGPQRPEERCPLPPPAMPRGPSPRRRGSTPPRSTGRPGSGSGRPALPREHTAGSASSLRTAPRLPPPGQTPLRPPIPAARPHLQPRCRPRNFGLCVNPVRNCLGPQIPAPFVSPRSLRGARAPSRPEPEGARSPACERSTAPRGWEKPRTHGSC